MFCSNTSTLTLLWTHSFILGQPWVANLPWYQAPRTVENLGFPHNYLGRINHFSDLPTEFWCCCFAVTVVATGDFNFLRLFVLFQGEYMQDERHSLALPSKKKKKKSWTLKANIVIASFCYLWRKWEPWRMFYDFLLNLCLVCFYPSQVSSFPAHRRFMN